MPNFTALKLDQKYIVPLSIALVVLISVIVSGFFIFQYFNLKNNLINGGKTASEAEVKELVAKVGKLMELPKGELPTVATVTDPAQLTSQPFFSAAKIGDKVLVYLNARKGILYRPDSNKIINVSPINVNKQAVSPTPRLPGGQASQFGNAVDETGGKVAGAVGVQTQTLRVAIYNGTPTSGVAANFERDLKEKVTDVQFNIVSKSNAALSNYKLTKVIDLKGNLDAQVLKIAAAFDGENAKLPTAEGSPSVDADILVIIGSDYTTKTQPTFAPTTAAIQPTTETPASP